MLTRSSGSNGSLALLIVDDHNTLVPDVGVIKQDRLKPHVDQHLKGAPDLAIEVMSPTDTATRL